MERFLRRYWGYLALALAIAGWFTHTFGYALVVIFSLIAFVYFLFAAPLWCGAEIRGGRSCRNNSRGLLIGCHIREHKWQRMKDIFITRKWREAIHDLFDSPKEILATLSGITSLISFVAALIVSHGHL